MSHGTISSNVVGCITAILVLLLGLHAALTEEVFISGSLQCLKEEGGKPEAREGFKADRQ